MPITPPRCITQPGELAQLVELLRSRRVAGGQSHRSGASQLGELAQLVELLRSRRVAGGQSHRSGASQLGELAQLVELLRSRRVAGGQSHRSGASQLGELAQLVERCVGEGWPEANRTAELARWSPDYSIRGISSAGRALRSHRRGQEFESPILHFGQGQFNGASTQFLWFRIATHWRGCTVSFGAIP
jgi:hypothetical protein